MEALVNPQISLGSWFTKLLGKYSKSGLTSETVALLHLGQIPNFIYRPGEHLLEMRSLYVLAKKEMNTLRPALSSLSQRLKGLSIGSASEVETKMLLTRVQARYGTVLSIATVLNRMLLIHYPFDNELELDTKNTRDQVLSLAATAAPFRPLGASYVPLLLVCSLAATQNDGARRELEHMLEDYESDYAGFHWRPMVAFLEKRFERATAKFLTASIGALTFEA